MDNVEILRILLALLILITILLSFILSLIIFRISLESDERDSKKEKEIKNRRQQNDR
jgi:regulatory protein YycH of two-component signal transduction system YycFG